MHSRTLPHRSIAKLVAGVLFAALSVVGLGTAHAATNLKVVKTALPPTIPVGGVATFRVEFSNLPSLQNPTNPNPDNAFDVEVIDYLPGQGVIDWSSDNNPDATYSESLLAGCSPGVQGTFPDQQYIVCDPGTIEKGQTEWFEISVVLPETGCMVLANTAVATSEDVLGNALPEVSGSATITVGACEGRMTGGGSIFLLPPNAKGKAKTATRITHGFELRCDPADHRQNLEINWPSATGGNQNNFHLESLEVAECTYDENIGPPNPPAAGFNTYYGKGDGTCNGQDASIEFWFTDAGEPGTKDTAQYIITGACELNTPETNLTKGNQQAHKN